MLNINKSITLNGEVIVKDGKLDKQVVYLNANISHDDGSDNINQTIQDKELYIANKAEIRKDIEDFMKNVYSIQDNEI